MSPAFVSIPEFRNGDLLSATKMNQLLSNLDATYGQDQRLEIGSQSDYWYTATYTWHGWVAFSGDTLVVNLYNSGVGDYVVSFDSSAKAHTHTVTFATAGVKTIPLPTNVGYSNNQVYKVTITGTYPTYAYMTASWLASVGTMPTFVNGAVSSASDFNSVRTATNTLYRAFNQPMPSGVSFPETQKIAAGSYFEFWTQYRHTWFKWLSQHKAPGSDDTTEHIKWSVFDGNDEYTFYATDLVAGTNLTLAERSAQLNSIDLTVGNWYRWRFSHESSDNPMPGWSIVYWYGQERYSTALLWTQLERWTYGDVVNGDAGATPNLYTMSSNLDWLNTKRRRWVNVVQRENRTTVPGALYADGEVFFSKRVHRWLAYESLNDEASAELKWSSDITFKNVLQSYSLPAAFGTTAFLDLEDTPIRNGQVIYGHGVKYMIQVETPPSGWYWGY